MRSLATAVPPSNRSLAAGSSTPTLGLGLTHDTVLHSSEVAALPPQPALEQLASTTDLRTTASTPSIALPTSPAAQFPLEPTPLDVPPSERELLAATFAEAGEQLLCVAAVTKLGDRSKRSDRIIAVGTYRCVLFLR